jgi:hypothetical protein
VVLVRAPEIVPWILVPEFVGAFDHHLDSGESRFVQRQNALAAFVLALSDVECIRVTPVTRAQLFKKFRGLEIHECPFANLPEARSGRWGQGLTKAKMAERV